MKWFAIALLLLAARIAAANPRSSFGTYDVTETRRGYLPTSEPGPPSCGPDGWTVLKRWDRFAIRYSPHALTVERETWTAHAGAIDVAGERPRSDRADWKIEVEFFEDDGKVGGWLSAARIDDRGAVQCRSMLVITAAHFTPR